MKVLRVAIVGCGKIAEQHVDAIRRIPSASLVAVCDTEPLMARQMAERRNIPNALSTLDEVFEQARPDVVHITTPPESHFPLADRCLDAGCHVYVEKPFTVSAQQALDLIRHARQSRLHITVGHNLQHTRESIEARRLVRAGFLGGPPVHMESYYTYSLGDAQYARSVLGDDQHWVRRLPGGLLHNIISHGIARLAEFLHSDDPVVVANGHTSPLLLALDEEAIIDELRVHVFDKHNTTASFVFSTQLSPPVNGLRLYGPENSLIIDNAHRTVVRVGRHGYKSYLNHFLPPLLDARELVKNSARNVASFLRADFHDDSGLKSCVEAFYSAVLGEGELPVSYREIELTATIMDRIFEQIAPAHMAGAVGSVGAHASTGSRN